MERASRLKRDAQVACPNNTSITEPLARPAFRTERMHSRSWTARAGLMASSFNFKLKCSPRKSTWSFEYSRSRTRRPCRTSTLGFGGGV